MDKVMNPICSHFLASSMEILLTRVFHLTGYPKHNCEYPPMVAAVRSNCQSQLGVQSLQPHLSIHRDDLWQTVLPLILSSWSNDPLSTQLRQDLLEWDAQGMVDWEYGLLQVIASHTTPGSTLREFGYLPTCNLIIGDVGCFGSDVGHTAEFTITYPLSKLQIQVLQSHIADIKFHSSM